MFQCIFPKLEYHEMKLEAEASAFSNLPLNKCTDSIDQCLRLVMGQESGVGGKESGVRINTLQINSQQLQKAEDAVYEAKNNGKPDKIFMNV